MKVRFNFFHYFLSFLVLLLFGIMAYSRKSNACYDWYIPPLVLFCIMLLDHVFMYPLLEVKGDKIYLSRRFRKPAVYDLADFRITLPEFFLGRVRFDFDLLIYKHVFWFEINRKDVKKLQETLEQKGHYGSTGFRGNR